MIPDADQLDALAVEYCRLFIGPRDHLPPIQSVWEASQLQSEIADSVRAFCDLYGYVLPAKYSGIIDHLGVELDIMSSALDRVAIPDAANEFFRRHLTWTDDFFKAAQASAESAFYKSLILVTGEFLQSESTARDMV